MRETRSLQVNLWREISILMVILMEACWVTPWFRSLTAATYGVGSVRVFIVLISVVLLTYLLVRAMDYIRLKKSVRQAIMVVFILIGILVGMKTMLYAHQFTTLFDLFNRPIKSFTDLTTLVPSEFIVILTILVAYWRGLSVAQGHIGPITVMDHFWLGIFMYVLFILINTLATGETPGEFFFLFLFCSLVAMCTSRMTVIGMLRGGTENKFNRFWLAGIVLAASLVVGLSALFGGLLGNQFNWIGSLLLGVFGSVLVLAWLVISPVISLLITIFGKLLNSLALQDLENNLQNLDQMFQGLGKNISDFIRESALAHFIERLAPALKLVIIISIIVIIILGIVAWMAIKLWEDRARRRLDGEQKSNLQSQNLFQRLLDLLRQGWSGTLNSLGGLLDVNRYQKHRAAARIRQVYADLMELCTSLDHPRDEASTPLEFLPELGQLFPTLHSEAGMITIAYDNVRYGQIPETQQEVEQIEAAWKSLSTAGRELYTTQKRVKKK
jgi:Domain of unknown function (DUF4129)